MNKSWCLLDLKPSAVGTQYQMSCSWTQQMAYWSDLKVVSGCLRGRV